MNLGTHTLFYSNDGFIYIRKVRKIFENSQKILAEIIIKGGLKNIIQNIHNLLENCFQVFLRRSSIVKKMV